MNELRLGDFKDFIDDVGLRTSRIPTEPYVLFVHRVWEPNDQPRILFSPDIQNPLCRGILVVSGSPRGGMSETQLAQTRGLDTTARPVRVLKYLYRRKEESPAVHDRLIAFRKKIQADQLNLADWDALEPPSLEPLLAWYLAKVSAIEEIPMDLEKQAEEVFAGFRTRNTFALETVAELLKHHG